MINRASLFRISWYFLARCSDIGCSGYLFCFDFWRDFLLLGFRFAWFLLLPLWRTRSFLISGTWARGRMTFSILVLGWRNYLCSLRYKQLFRFMWRGLRGFALLALSHLLGFMFFIGSIIYWPFSPGGACFWPRSRWGRSFFRYLLFCLRLFIRIGVSLCFLTISLRTFYWLRTGSWFGAFYITFPCPRGVRRWGTVLLGSSVLKQVDKKTSINT